MAKRASTFAVLLLAMTCFYVVPQWYINVNITKNAWLSASPLPTNMNIPYIDRSPINLRGSTDRVIVFIALEMGQGIGNQMSGLLAAHLLALEFGRTLCLVPSDFKQFLENFEIVDRNALAICPRIVKSLPQQSQNNILSLINFHPPPNECELQDMLASDQGVLFLRSNTYPRWPSVPDNFFFRYYKPKESLIKSLSYHKPPETVVHLRMADGPSDPRKGNDEESLNALATMLPRSTFLVTNYVSWFDTFNKSHGWSHPDWSKVTHSSITETRDWGSRETTTASARINKQERQVWADWLTILTSKRVYHTHSDFSASAVHWMNIREAKIVEGMRSGKLELSEEVWRREGETPPLVGRTRTASGTMQLRICDQTTPMLHHS
jgi:hypothetical protein